MPTPCLLDHPGRHKVNLRDCLTLPTTARPVYYAPIQYHKVSKAIELARTCPSNCSLIMKIRFFTQENRFINYHSIQTKQSRTHNISNKFAGIFAYQCASHKHTEPFIATISTFE